MIRAYDVAVFVGSRRRAGRSRRIAEYMRRLAPATLNLEIVETADLGHHDRAAAGAPPPASWRDFRCRVDAADAVLFVSPQYDHSVAAPLRTALDIGSPPDDRNVWAGKPAGVVSISLGAIDGFDANPCLRRSLGTLDVSVMPKIAIGVGRPGRCAIAADRVIDEPGRLFLVHWLETFVEWMRTAQSSRPTVVQGEIPNVLE